MATAPKTMFRVGVRLDPAKEPVEHLVMATSLPQAKEHVTQGIVTGEKASPEDIYRLAQKGVKLEDATAPAAQAPAAKSPTPKTK